MLEHTVTDTRSFEEWQRDFMLALEDQARQCIAHSKRLGISRNESQEFTRRARVLGQCRAIVFRER